MYNSEDREVEDFENERQCFLNSVGITDLQSISEIERNWGQCVTLKEEVREEEKHSGKKPPVFSDSWPRIFSSKIEAELWIKFLMIHFHRPWLEYLWVWWPWSYSPATAWRAARPNGGRPASHAATGQEQWRGSKLFLKKKIRILATNNFRLFLYWITIPVTFSLSQIRIKIVGKGEVGLDAAHHPLWVGGGLSGVQPPLPRTFSGCQKPLPGSLRSATDHEQPLRGKIREPKMSTSAGNTSLAAYPRVDLRTRKLRLCGIPRPYRRVKAQRLWKCGSQPHKTLEES